MSFWLDKTFINRVSPLLESFKWKKDDLAVFRCPVCGDSKRNKSKTRGYFYRNKDSMAFKCHNCEASMFFGTFLKQYHPSLYKEYLMDKFKDSNTPNSKKPTMKETKEFREKFQSKPDFTNTILSDLENVGKMDDDHPIRKYLLNRKIPLDFLKDIWYTKTFKQYVNSIKPKTFENFPKDEERIIIPFRGYDKKVFAIQGRSMESNNSAKYITIKLDEEHLKIFGLDRFVNTKRGYVVEGPFDSFFIKNCVAVGGSDLLTCPIKNCVYIFDNEPRNKEIVSKMERTIERGKPIVIWPNNIAEDQDINDMVLDGMNIKELVAINTYSGLSAKLKFGNWRKV
jgi:hypothetical protein